MATNHTVFQNIQLAISNYAQEAWTKEKQLNSTGIVASDVNITDSGESFIGQLRWYKPVEATINNLSLTDSAAGTVSTISTDIADYIKNLRSTGFRQVNMQEVISKENSIAKYSEFFAKNRSFDEHTAILSTLKGVAAAEVGVGAGLVDFDSLADNDTGFFVDINAAGEFGAAATIAADERKLVDASQSGAAQGERLFRAMGMAWKDYEPEYVYMITSPQILADLRGANLIDEDRVQDGNLTFQTLFNGKFRLITTRAAQGNLSGEANVNVRSTKTTFLVKPGSIAFSEVRTPVPTEIDRDAKAYAGGGTTDIWYRYGFIVHPMGYDWSGSTSTFATNTTLGAAASWTRKMDHLNLGILPVFHA